MTNVNKEYIKSCRELFNVTGSPVFGALLLYMERTGNVLTLEGVGLNKDKQDELTL